MDGFALLIVLAALPGVLLAAALALFAWLAHGGNAWRYFRIWCLFLGVIGLGVAIALRTTYERLDRADLAAWQAAIELQPGVQAQAEFDISYLCDYLVLVRFDPAFPEATWPALFEKDVSWGAEVPGLVSDWDVNDRSGSLERESQIPRLVRGCGRDWDRRAIVLGRFEATLKGRHELTLELPDVPVPLRGAAVLLEVDASSSAYKGLHVGTAARDVVTALWGANGLVLLILTVLPLLGWFLGATDPPYPEGTPREGA